MSPTVQESGGSRSIVVSLRSPNPGPLVFNTALYITHHELRTWFRLVPFCCCCPCTPRNVTRLKPTWALAEIGVSIMDTGALSTSARRLLYCTTFTASGDSIFGSQVRHFFPSVPASPPSNSSTCLGHSPFEDRL